jgi:hypothetical protein
LTGGQEIRRFVFKEFLLISWPPVGFDKRLACE